MTRLHWHTLHDAAESCRIRLGTRQGCLPLAPAWASVPRSSLSWELHRMDECCSSAACCLPAVPSCVAVGGRTWSCELCGRFSCYRYRAYGRDGRGWCRTTAGGAQLGEMWIEEAQKCGSARLPAGHPLGALRCVARQCAKNRLVTYQLKGALFRSTHAPCCPVTGRV